MNGKEIGPPSAVVEVSQTMPETLGFDKVDYPIGTLVQHKLLPGKNMIIVGYEQDAEGGFIRCRYTEGNIGKTGTIYFTTLCFRPEEIKVIKRKV